ncbi:MAG: lasso peptide biosynthesis B2 protein [Gemmatimonadota bacterium]
MSRMRPPGLLTCLSLLAISDIGLRLFGFGRMLRAARHFSTGSNSAADRSMIGATIHQVLAATAIYPGRSKCLEQSIVTYVLLRRRGFDAQLRLGVQPYPFFAHAWVELDGVPITESMELVAGLAVLPEVAV